ncbi:MAG: hypothetical protein IJB02_02855 [Oscillospiraceae bacterium]|nr:hypothetical protein [Oscillospiraceae bacterium]
MAQMKTLTVSGQTYTVNDPAAVSFQEKQALSPQQQQTARENIGVTALDDRKAGKAPWSAEHILQALCPVFQDAGNMVQCCPVEGSKLEPVSRIQPVQGGTGEPSPENIRPITGQSVVKLTRCGKNLFNIAKGKSSNATVNGNTIRVIKSANGGRSSGNVPLNIPANTSFTVSGKLIGTNGTTTNPWMVFVITESGKYHGINQSNVSADGTFSWNRTFTEAITKSYIQVEMTEEAGVYVELADIQIEFGKKTDYEPYNGDTFTFDLGQTVYGGAINWATGELTCTHKGMAMKGLGWYVVGAMICAPLADGIRSGSIGVPCWCNMYATATTTQEVNGIINGTNTKITVGSNLIDIGCMVAVGNPQGLSVSDFKTALSKNDALLVYQLAEPVTIQLTPQEIFALSGVNTLYSDTGDTAVTGREAPASVFEKLTNAVIALGGNV